MRKVVVKGAARSTTAAAVAAAPESDPALAEEISAIRKILDQDQVDHFQLGIHLNRITDGKLAQKAGYKNSFALFERQFPDLSRTEVYRYSAVARTFTEGLARKYGISKLDLLLSYSTLAHLTLDADPVNAPIKVPEDGQSILKTFGECSVKDLANALSFLKHPTLDVIPPDDMDQIRVLHRALTMGTGEESHVSLKAYLRAGVTMLNVEHIPLALFAKVMATLAEAAKEAGEIGSAPQEKAVTPSVARSGTAPKASVTKAAPRKTTAGTARTTKSKRRR